MKTDSLESFVSEVFNNLYNITDHHQRMLAALFARQRDQHPLIQSIADVVLEGGSSVTPMSVPRSNH